MITPAFLIRGKLRDPRILETIFYRLDEKAEVRFYEWGQIYERIDVMRYVEGPTFISRASFNSTYLTSRNFKASITITFNAIHRFTFYATSVFLLKTSRVRNKNKGKEKSRLLAHWL